MRKKAVVFVMILVILCLGIWAQNSEKLNAVLPVAHLIEISKGALSHITSLVCNLLREIAIRAGEAISAISLEIFRVLAKIASDLDARMQSVLHRPII